MTADIHRADIIKCVVKITVGYCRDQVIAYVIYMTIANFSDNINGKLCDYMIVDVNTMMLSANRKKSALQ